MDNKKRERARSAASWYETRNQRKDDTEKKVRSSSHDDLSFFSRETERTNITRVDGFGPQPGSAAKPVANVRKHVVADNLLSLASSEPMQTKSAVKTKRMPERKRQDFLWTSLETIIKQGRDNEEYYINQIEDTWNKLQREKDKRKVLKDLNCILKRRLGYLKDVNGYLSGATLTDTSRLEELQMKEIELQRRQEKLEEENAHEVVPKYLQTKAKLLTSEDLERAVEDKTKQIIEDKNAALARNENILTDIFDEMNTELWKAQEEIAKLNWKLSMCKPEEKQKLLKRLEIKEREVVKLQGLQNILVKRNTLLRDAVKSAEIYKADQHGHSDLSNILRPTIEKEVQLEMECNTFKAELENIKSEYESVQRMEPNRFKEDAYGQMGPGRCNPEEEKQLQKRLEHKEKEDTALKEYKEVLETKNENLKQEIVIVKADYSARGEDSELRPLDVEQAFKQWTDNMESTMRKRLTKKESEVEILQKHRGAMRHIKYELQTIVGMKKDDSESRAYDSKLSNRLEQLVGEVVEVYSNVEKELSNLERECSQALTDTSEVEAIGNHGNDLRIIEMAVRKWTQTMNWFTGDLEDNFLKYQKATVELMLILNGHFQTMARSSEEFDILKLKTVHIVDIIQDQFAGYTWYCSRVKEDILFDIWYMDRPDASNIFETERKVCEKRLADCENTFGEGSPYYEYVAAENTVRVKKLDQFISLSNQNGAWRSKESSHNIKECDLGHLDELKC